MKTTYELSEAEISQAVAEYVAAHKNTTGKTKVSLRCDKIYDPMDRDTGLSRVVAHVTVED